MKLEIEHPSLLVTEAVLDFHAADRGLSLDPSGVSTKPAAGETEQVDAKQIIFLTDRVRGHLEISVAAAVPIRSSYQTTTGMYTAKCTSP
jgi:hypothetical protein